jgi:hypothetical protein
MLMNLDTNVSIDHSQQRTCKGIARRTRLVIPSGISLTKNNIIHIIVKLRTDIVEAIVEASIDELDRRGGDEDMEVENDE